LAAVVDPQDVLLPVSLPILQEGRANSSFNALQEHQSESMTGLLLAGRETGSRTSADDDGGNLSLTICRAQATSWLGRSFVSQKDNLR